MFGVAQFSHKTKETMPSPPLGPTYLSISRYYKHWFSLALNQYAYSIISFSFFFYFFILSFFIFTMSYWIMYTIIIRITFICRLCVFPITITVYSKTKKNLIYIEKFKRNGSFFILSAFTVFRRSFDFDNSVPPAGRQADQYFYFPKHLRDETFQPRLT